MGALSFISIEELRRAARVNGDHLDGELIELAETAAAELVRSGVKEEVVMAGGHLVRLAILSFVRSEIFEDNALAERYRKSFETLQDSIRRSQNVQ